MYDLDRFFFYSLYIALNCHDTYCQDEKQNKRRLRLVVGLNILGHKVKWQNRMARYPFLLECSNQKKILEDPFKLKFYIEGTLLFRQAQGENVLRTLRAIE